MSIASRITSIEGHIGDIYDSVELTGVDTTDIDKNLINVPNTLKEGYIDIINNGTDTLYNNFPKVSGEGTSLTLNNTYQAPMRNNLKGNTSQTGTPTPTSPIPVNVVSGDNEINVCGKNFLDNTKIVKGKIDNGVIGYESGTTSLTTTSDSISFTTNANYRGVSTYYIELQNSVYFIINWQSADNTLAMTAHFYDKDKNYISQKGGYQSSSTSFRWANDVQNAKYVRITISLNSLGSVNVIKPQFQFVNDLNIPTYEPYQGNTYNIDLPEGMELCKIGNYQDYFYKDSDKWYLHKEIGKAVLNGSELWQIHGSIASWFYCDILDNVRYAISENLGISNYYSYKPYYPNATTLVNGEFTIGYGANNIGRVVMKNTDYTTVNDFRTWLSSNNVSVYYILATPTNTEITDTTLINQLEQFYQAQSKNNQTNISQINNDLGFIISASALKKG